MRIQAILLLGVLFLFLSQCRKPANADDVPPGLSLTDAAPEWVKNYQLVLPHVAIYKSGENYVYKSLEKADTIAGFYLGRFRELEFSTIIDMNQEQGRLLQFQKKTEVISVEIKALPYSKNKLIRLGRSTIKIPAGMYRDK